MFSSRKNISCKRSKISFGEFYLPKYDLKVVDYKKAYSVYLNELIAKPFQISIIPAGGLNRYLWNFTR